jgi:hypothetical protein
MTVFSVFPLVHQCFLPIIAPFRRSKMFWTKEKARNKVAVMEKIMPSTYGRMTAE